MSYHSRNLATSLLILIGLVAMILMLIVANAGKKSSNKNASQAAKQVSSEEIGVTPEVLAFVKSAKTVGTGNGTDEALQQFYTSNKYDLTDKDVLFIMNSMNYKRNQDAILISWGAHKKIKDTNSRP